MSTPPRRPLRSRLGLACRVLIAAAEVGWIRTSSPTLPGCVNRVTQHGRHVWSEEPVRRLARGVDRVLRLGPLRPRCITNSLVLLRLLARQGTSASLVLGLPSSPGSKDAHAWVEIGHEDVGPPPGRMRHQEMARYPREGASV